MTSKGFNRPGQLSNPIRRAKQFKRRYDSKYPKKKCYWGKYFEPHDDVILTCKNCKKDIQVKYKRRKMKFCSLSCATTYNNLKRWKTKYVVTKCPVCKKSFKQSSRIKNKHKFCSKDCYFTWRKLVAKSKTQATLSESSFNMGLEASAQEPTPKLSPTEITSPNPNIMPNLWGELQAGCNSTEARRNL